MVLIVVVHTLSRVWFFVIPRTAAHWAGQGSFTISWGLLKLRSIESVMPCKHLILCRLLLLLPSIFASIRVFSSESVLQIRWPKYWSFSSSISPSSEYSRLISFRMDWLDLLAVQGTHKDLLQHHSSKASILQCLAFFTVLFSHLYMTTGNTISLVQFSSVAQSCPTLCDSMNRSTPGLPVHHQLPEFTQTHVHWVGDAIQPSRPLSSPSPPALTIWTFVGKVIFLLFNTLCRFVIAFLQGASIF